MDFKKFERLYLGDRVIFMLAMELFLESGREKILVCTQQELSASAAPGLSGFLTSDKIDAVAQTAKEFAALKTEDGHGSNDQPQCPQRRAGDAEGSTGHQGPKIHEIHMGPGV